jgi:hypothetical protein
MNLPRFAAILSVQPPLALQTMALSSSAMMAGILTMGVEMMPAMDTMESSMHFTGIDTYI